MLQWIKLSITPTLNYIFLQRYSICLVVYSKDTCHPGGVRVIPWEVGVFLESPHQFTEVRALTATVTNVKKSVC